MTNQTLWGALALALTAACGTRDPACGAMLEYDPGSRRCVCRGVFVCVTPDDCQCLPGDAGVPADGPESSLSAPTVTIGPDPAHTTEDLEVTIVDPSRDSLGIPIRYEFAWARDGAAAAEWTTALVPASETTRGERWTVSVTPVTDDGRRGPPGVDEAVIANSAPVLTTVGLDQYHPVVGERIRAVPGSASDEDGDVPGIRYQWYRGESPIPAATGAVLDLLGLTPSEEVSLEAWAADDADEGPRVRVGPVRVSSDETRWRAIAPAAPTLFDAGTNNLGFDDAHERVVRWIDGKVWEYVARDGALVATELAPRGTPPRAEHYQFVLHDSLNQRLLVVDADDPSLLHALDLRRRGHEEWAVLSTTGPVPAGHTPSYTVWSGDGHIWLMGHDSTAPDDRLRLYSLRVGSIGGELWTEYSLGPDAPQMLASSVGAHPTMTSRWIVLGGFDVEAGGFNRDVYALDVTGASAAFSVIGALPFDRAAARAVNVGASEIWVAGGQDAPVRPSPEQDVLAFDVATGAVRTVARLPAGQAVFAVSDGPGGAIVGQLSDEVLDVSRVDSASRSAVRLGRERVAASPLSIAAHERDAVVLETSGGSWTARELDLATERWGETRSFDFAPPLTTGVVAIGTQRDASRASSPMWGGRIAATGELAPTDSLWLFEAQGSEASWTRTAITGPGPTARASTTIVGASCLGRPTYVVAGGYTAPMHHDDAWVLTCYDICTWTPTTGAPSSRSGTQLVATTYGDVLLFGGTTESGVTDELWSLEACGSGGWTRVTPSGTSPGARSGHALVRTGNSGGYDRFITVGGGAAPAQPTRLVMNRSEARWESVPLAADSELPDAPGSFAVWHAAENRLIAFGSNGTWELRVR